MYLARVNRHTRRPTPAAPLAQAFACGWLVALLLAPARSQAQAPAPTGPYTVVVATVSKAAEADAIWARLPAVAEGLLLRQAGPRGARYWVAAGRLTDRPAAERLLASLRKLYPRAWVLDLGPRALAEPPADSAAPAPAPSSLAGFRTAYSRLHTALASLDARRLQPFIHPELGLWLRHTPHRLTVVQHSLSLDELLELPAYESAAARRALELAIEAYAPALLPPDSLLATATAPTPQACADTDTLVRQPRLLSPPLPARLSTTLLAAKVQLLGDGLSADEARRTARAEGALRLALVRPYAPPLRGLYFAFEADRWYLTLIDLSCEP